MELTFLMVCCFFTLTVLMISSERWLEKEVGFCVQNPVVLGGP